ncbi:MAG: hypothetical protein EBR29_03295 [Sphingobacteriia bacterium]|nr:hypothetical protein [Sphingobacteriia bacterium]
MVFSHLIGFLPAFFQSERKSNPFGASLTTSSPIYWDMGFPSTARVMSKCLDLCLFLRQFVLRRVVGGARRGLAEFLIPSMAKEPSRYE